MRRKLRPYLRYSRYRQPIFSRMGMWNSKYSFSMALYSFGSRLGNPSANTLRFYVPSQRLHIVQYLVYFGAHVAVPKSQGLQKITTSPVSMENHIYGFGRRLDGPRKHTSFQITILTASISSEPANVSETRFSLKTLLFWFSHKA